jgi:hypothetical protein
VRIRNISGRGITLPTLAVSLPADGEADVPDDVAQRLVNRGQATPATPETKTTRRPKKATDPEGDDD